MNRNPERNEVESKGREWFVYILLCQRNGSFYVGITPDVDGRLKLHQRGKASKHTRENGPVRLVYSRKYQNKSEARKREIQIKGWSREKKEKLISGEWK